ncbi:class I SAM-dependent methyltransferase [Parvibaculum sp.]|uniref:class I SAM-dependent methyltransferase n=1 Tax=Parvibaculum sp. TaxID=2024848 RepID=UPI001B2EA96E|nr:class I SAM-dependent methyltransferase [Parvibaculum sp.]MBO6635151.1 class I SAM-dependent methyltransferase [Parvibaculum sp.]MBO6678710.1 class I SAM-dependent methyltransferase [Parvibaculum sp.]MBO6685669.1 class I SAM-dependent methyltransferase [Parvibaculum sp.]
MQSEAAKEMLAHFNDPQAVAQYTEGPVRFVPGYAELHRMTAILLGERAGPHAKVLVLGAGGGMELKALADAHPGWTFEGVDPAREMLKLAERVLGEHAARAELREGYIEDASEGPFDAAACLLTLHFLDRGTRVRTAAEIRRRLTPGAPFVAAHSSFPQGASVRPQWLSRYAAYAVASGADPEMAEKARASVAAHLDLLTPEEDEAVLREAGFSEVTPFYAAFTWRGWVAYA